MGAHPQPARIAPPASPEEAAAIVAAVERFRRVSASPTAQAPISLEEWARAAILEGVSRQPDGDTPDPWINT